MSKQIILMLALSCSYLQIIKAQGKTPMVKLYAYQHELVQATEQVIAKVGDSSFKNASVPTSEYRVYMEMVSAWPMVVKRVWLLGKEFNAYASLIRTPVLWDKTVRVIGEPAADTLVPFTKNPVVEIRMNGPVRRKKPVVVPEAASNELVIEFFFRGKRYLKSVKKFHHLATRTLY